MAELAEAEELQKSMAQLLTAVGGAVEVEEADEEVQAVEPEAAKGPKGKEPVVLLEPDDVPVEVAEEILPEDVQAEVAEVQHEEAEEAPDIPEPDLEAPGVEACEPSQVQGSQAEACDPSQLPPEEEAGDPSELQAEPAEPNSPQASEEGHHLHFWGSESEEQRDFTGMVLRPKMQGKHIHQLNVSM